MKDRTYQVAGGTLAETGSGWAEWIPPGARGRVRLRVSRDRRGRRTITEVRVADEKGVAAGELRRIPLGALEDVLNGPKVVESSARFTATASVDVRQVAVEYTDAAAVTRHPARKVAEDRGVSRRTVSRWLSEARRQGHLGPARRSRRGK